MNKPICIAKKAGIVAERGKASIEWYKDGEPQYYCYGYMDKSTDYYIEVCRNCKNNVIYAQDDMDKHKRDGKDE